MSGLCAKAPKVSISQLTADWGESRKRIEETLATIPYFMEHRRPGKKPDFSVLLASLQQQVEILRKINEDSKRRMDSFDRPVFWGLTKQDLQSGATAAFTYGALGASFGLALWNKYAGNNVSHSSTVVLTSVALGAAGTRDYLSKKTADGKKEQTELKTKVIDDAKFIETVEGIILLHDNAKEPSPPRELDKQPTGLEVATPTHGKAASFELPHSSTAPAGMGSAHSAPAPYRRVDIKRHDSDFERTFLRAIQRAVPGLGQIQLPQENLEEIERLLYANGITPSSPVRRQNPVGTEAKEPEGPEIVVHSSEPLLAVPEDGRLAPKPEKPILTTFSETRI